MTSIVVMLDYIDDAGELHCSTHGFHDGCQLAMYLGSHRVNY